jgi:hypothetical protein
VLFELMQRAKEAQYRLLKSIARVGAATNVRKSTKRTPRQPFQPITGGAQQSFFGGRIAGLYASKTVQTMDRIQRRSGHGRPPNESRIGEKVLTNQNTGSVKPV